jgi:hypothetical protein
MAEPARKLGPYTLVSRIGVGGFGVVSLAEKRTVIATTQFALKLPRGEDIDLEAFKQEAAYQRTDEIHRVFQIPWRPFRDPKPTFCHSISNPLTLCHASTHRLTFCREFLRKLTN